MVERRQQPLDDRYDVDDRLRLGNFDVLRATDTATGQRVRLKAPPAGSAATEDLLRELARQAEVIGGFSHPNVSALEHFYASGDIAALPYLVCAGLAHSGSHLVKADALSQDNRLDLCRQLLQGLNHCHQRGALNLELSERSLEVSADLRELRIADFGVCAEHIADIPVSPDYFYSAPELFDPQSTVTACADVYSAGLLCLRLLAGNEAFKALFSDVYSGEESLPRADRFLNWHLDASRSLPDYDAGLLSMPRPVYEVLQTMCAKDPAARFRDVNEALAAFARVAGGHSWDEQSLRPIELEEMVQPIDNRRKWLLVAGGVAVVLMLCAIGFALLKPQPVDVDSILAKAKAARERAVLVGAEALGIPAFADGQASYQLASESYQRRDDVASVEQLRAAIAHYEQSQEDAAVSLRQQLQNEEQSSLARLRLLQPVGADQLAQDLNADYDALRLAAGEQAYEPLLAGAADLQSALNKQLARLPRNFTRGSSAQEIDAALALCEETSGGCERSWYDTELEQLVELRPFRLDAAEVSYQEFREFTDAIAYVTTAEALGYAFWFDGRENQKREGMSWRNPEGEGAPEDGSQPVRFVSATDAQSYCRWRNARLPTEAEWEYASRGPERYAYTWGDEWQAAQLQLNRGKPHTVGGFAQDAFFTGLADLTGNVWEWVTLADGGYGLKGGSYLESSPANFRSAARRDEITDVVHSDDGFRCAYDSERWPPQRPLNLQRG